MATSNDTESPLTPQPNTDAKTVLNLDRGSSHPIAMEHQITVKEIAALER